jgi:primosomal protein N' (replication factor Y)
VAGAVSQARRPPARAGAASREPAASLPVAQVAVDMSLAHLDRPFEYLVPEALSAGAVPGCRVRVRFAGRLISGFVLSRTAQSEHQGKLGYLERVVSPEPVLTPEIAGLARAVADRYGGTLADVLRLAIPPRHGGAEAAATLAPPESPEPAAENGDQPAGSAGPPESPETAAESAA